jgi:hypothetical protein
MTTPLDLSIPENAALARYHYHELEFAKDGSVVDPDQGNAVSALADSVTDLLVMSHGWNNNIDQARGLYRGLSTSFETVSARSPIDLDGRTLGILGVLWPSKRFTEAELIPGGVAGLVSDPTLPADLRDMSDAFDDADAEAKLAAAADLAGQLDDSVDARNKYADLLRSLIDSDSAEPADAADEFFSVDGDVLLGRLQEAMIAVMQGVPEPGQPGGTGGIQAIEPVDGGMGGAGGIGDLGGVGGIGTSAGLFSGAQAAWSKGRALLNYVTYYTMKSRAGKIGEHSLGPILHDHVVGRTRLHLIGHSFGARLVTAAANALPDPGDVSSVSLLQAAFSHNSFSADFGQGKPGGFRHLVDNNCIQGPMIITHTRNDQAVGIAYAIASTIHHQNANAVGDPGSQYGGLGSNGAQHTNEARNDQALQDVEAKYTFDNHVIHNLLADQFISGHGDVRNVQVANAVLQAIAAAPTA